MTKFQKALQAECARCGWHASHHRMTKTTFYCLTLNAKGRARYLRPFSKNTGLVDLNQIVYHTKVANLQHAEFAIGVRTEIAQGLSLIRDVS